MAKVDVFDMDRKKVEELELSDDVFFGEVKEHLFWEVVKWQLARRRAGTASTRGRSEIRGSTRKLFRQKGTGRARRGSIKSPLLRSGGTVFGPKPRDYSYNVPKKVRAKALMSALSRRAQEKNLVVVDKLELPEAKTKLVAGFMKTFELQSALIVDQDNPNAALSGRNLQGVKVLPVQGLNVYDILKYDHLVLTKRAVAAIEGRLKS